MNPGEWIPQRYVSLIPTFCCRTGWHNFVVFVGIIEKYVLIQILRVQILNTLILIMSPWGWVGEGIGLNAKSTPRQFQKNAKLSINIDLAITSRAIFWKTSLTLTKESFLVTSSKWSIIWLTPPSSKSSIPLILLEVKVGLSPFLRSWISLNWKSLKTRTSPSTLVRSPAPESCASDQTRRTGATRNCQSSSPKSRIKAWWSKSLHQDLFEDIWVCDRQPGCRHVVEPVDLAIHPVTLHVQLREIDLNNHYWTFFLSKFLPFFSRRRMYPKTCCANDSFQLKNCSISRALFIN